MPSKKTVQPPPLESSILTLRDGSTVELEIRDETCNIIGRGLHKRDKHQALCDRVLKYVVDKYLSAKGPKKLRNPFMNSAKDLDAEMARSGLFPEVTDFGSVRKRIYPYVKLHLDIYTKCVAENNSRNDLEPD